MASKGELRGRRPKPTPDQIAGLGMGIVSQLTHDHTNAIATWIRNKFMHHAVCLGSHLAPKARDFDRDRGALRDYVVACDVVQRNDAS